VDRCGFRLTAVYASHDRDSIGVLVECEGTTLYFSGDTLFVPMLLMMNRFKPDVAFICINGKMGNMSYYEAALYCKLLEAKAAAPTHYDLIQHNTEDPGAFIRTLENVSPQTKGVLLKKGLEYEISDFLRPAAAPDNE
jgi:L-ascorbate metabolism protein UlaG (beta-lactamase superfamily)